MVRAVVSGAWAVVEEERWLAVHFEELQKSGLVIKALAKLSWR
jgi:hypothetical protein